jgi:predicted tellurium resistance membrane protein TerC
MEFVIAFITLTFLEVVLGIDNIIFVSLVTNKLPKEKQKKARFIGLSLALVMRIILLITIAWLIHHLTAPFFPLEGMTKEQTADILNSKETKGFSESAYYIFHTVGVRELILMIGGLFLISKSVSEIHHKVVGILHDSDEKSSVSFGKTIGMIVMLDLVFSFDSILTAVGITENIYAMVAAVTIAMFIMLMFSKTIGEFISKNPTVEMLALSFLILIGFMLVLEGVCIEVPKAYIYFAVFFSFAVELLNLRAKRGRHMARIKHRNKTE